MFPRCILVSVAYENRQAPYIMYTYSVCASFYCDVRGLLTAYNKMAVLTMLSLIVTLISSVSYHTFTALV